MSSIASINGATRWTVLLAASAVVFSLALSNLSPPLSAAASTAKPTVVLIHGAFADASGWSGVIEQLQKDGYPVIAPANPLRSLSGDSAYVASILAQTPGP